MDRTRVRAPRLRGRGWLGTGGRELDLAALRGRVVLLDLWTSCCANCWHVLDELRALEQRFGDALVVIGVHSPKFRHEADPQTVADAVARFDVHHPVLDDPELLTWDAYAARAWPTLVLIDPDGYVVAQMAGEGHGPGLVAMIDELVAAHGVTGGDTPYVAPAPPPSALRFPGGALLLPDRLGGGVLVADTAHHQLVVLEPDLITERRRIGGGVRGPVDSAAGEAAFAEPLGLVALPAEVAEAVGYDVVVADSVAHVLRGVRLTGADPTVVTVAGTGAQLRERLAPGVSAPAAATPLSTPWGLAWWGDRVIVAMAGVHQLWAFDPRAGTVAVLAGTTNEGLRDGPVTEAFFAQPSGLAADEATGRLWVIDAETSALRELAADPAAGPAVSTAVGHGLFDFGHRDGDPATALLQHPLAAAVLPDGSVAIADTYNGAVRRWSPVVQELTTLAQDLREPGALLVDGDTLIVVESAAHRLTRLPLPASTRDTGAQRRIDTGAQRRIDTGAHRVSRSPVPLAGGEVELTVAFTPPPGQHLDVRFGDPTALTVSASPPGLLIDGAGTGSSLTRRLRFAPDAADGVLQVSVTAVACDAPVDGTTDAGVFAACHRYQQDWGIPLILTADAPTRLTLDLLARS